MKHIKAIGFDMDYTLVRYHSDVFEELTFEKVQQKLVKDYGYPKEVLDFKFEFNRAIRGLVIDKQMGNLIKLSTFGKVKLSYHGTKELNFRQQQKCYKGLSIDLNDELFRCIDTSFSIAHANIYQLLVDLKDKHPEKILKSYFDMEQDVMDAVDLSHRDGTLKDVVKKNLDKYIIQDPKTVEVLERFKSYGKRLWVITNSDYDYSQALLDHTINPYLKNHKDWKDLFEIVITLSSKPRFFTDRQAFLKVDTETGLLSNFDQPLVPGVYQGGNAEKLQHDFNVSGDDVLYLGDHIYGDVLKIKKTCNWRTALVIEELNNEVQSYLNSKDTSKEIRELMQAKIDVEKNLDSLYTKEFEKGKKVTKDELHINFSKIEKIDKQIGKLIRQYQRNYNPYWGEVMRAGVDPSRFVSQIEKYACIYMSKVSDFADYGPRSYFRPKKRLLTHELK